MSPTSYRLLYSAVYWAAKVETIFETAKFFFDSVGQGQFDRTVVGAEDFVVDVGSGDP